jgi:hypothetical protein
MKINWTRLFSLSVSDSEYYEDKKDKIEFVGCKVTHRSCINYLPAINDNFRDSENFFRNKDYNRAIDALERAYYIAGELQKSDCRRCSLFFQATVVQSLTNIHIELRRMSKGLFGTTRYQECYLKADALLNKFKTVKEVKPVYAPARKNQVLLPAYY